MGTMIKIFSRFSTTQFFHISKKYFTFLTEGYTFEMAKINNFCLMLVPNWEKIAGIIFRRDAQKCVLASIRFRGRPSISEIHEISLK